MRKTHRVVFEFMVPDRLEPVVSIKYMTTREFNRFIKGKINGKRPKYY